MGYNFSANFFCNLHKCFWKSLSFYNTQPLYTHFKGMVSNIYTI